MANDESSKSSRSRKSSPANRRKTKDNDRQVRKLLANEKIRFMAFSDAPHELTDKRRAKQTPINTKQNCPKPRKPKTEAPCNEFRFVNQLGTRDQDEEAKSEVKSHVMRRVWKKHKDSQAKWIKRLPPLRSKEPETPTSDMGSESSYFGSPEPQSRYSVPSSHHLTPRSSVTPAPSADGTEPLISTQVGDSVDHSIIPIPSGYAHVSPRLAAYIFGSDSDPFGTFPIPITPRVHELINQSKSTEVNLTYSIKSVTLTNAFRRCPSQSAHLCARRRLGHVLLMRGNQCSSTLHYTFLACSSNREFVRSREFRKLVLFAELCFCDKPGVGKCGRVRDFRGNNCCGCMHDQHGGK